MLSINMEFNQVHPICDKDEYQEEEEEEFVEETEDDDTDSEEQPKIPHIFKNKNKEYSDGLQDELVPEDDFMDE